MDVKIGVIGTGAMGSAFARHAANAGYEVILSNSRGPESLSAMVNELGGETRAGSVRESALADVIFLAVPWKFLPEAVSVITSWKNRIVIDPSNPIIMPGYQTADLGGKLSSEIVASLLPGARLVKAFNALPAAALEADPREAGGRRVIFYSGDDTEAKNIVGDIIDKMGFAGIDLGGLTAGGRLQHYPDGPLTALNLIRLA